MSLLSLNGWKGLSMAVFTVMSIIGAAAAVIMKERANQLYITCGVLFSAGVLLAGGFVHLLVDCNEQFEELGIEFAWGYTIAGLTVVLLSSLEISIDRSVGKYLNKQKEDNSTHNKNSISQKAQGDDPCSPTKNEDGNKQEEEVSKEAEEESREEEEEEIKAQSKSLSTTTDDESCDHDHNMMIPTIENPFNAILLSIALSIHSIIEGIGIGASQDVSDLESAFIAVAFHKGFTAFALGNGLVSSGYWEKGMRKYFYISVGTFIFVALLGIGIGWAISAGGEGLATAILTGITAGSFVYVALLEVLPDETKNIKKMNLLLIPCFFFFLAGYGLMAMLAIWA